MRFAQHRLGDVVRLRQEGVAGGHALRDHRLHAAEQLLVLEFLVGKAHQCFERDLVAEPIFAAELQHLDADVALDQAEDVGVAAALDLAHQASLVGAEEIQLADLGQPVGQEFLRVIEFPAADHVAVDFPSNALGNFDDFCVAFARLNLLHGCHGCLLVGLREKVMPGLRHVP